MGEEPQVGRDEEPVRTRLADSGAREVAENGFTREPEADGKTDWTWLFETRGLELVPPELIQRIAEHFYQGGLKYSPDNWRRGTSPEALARYRRSAARHFAAWMRHEDDEDHAAACAWNLFVFEINRDEAQRQWEEHGPYPELAAYLDATDPPVVIARSPIITAEDLGREHPTPHPNDPDIDHDKVELVYRRNPETGQVVGPPCGHTPGNHPIYCEFR